MPPLTDPELLSCFKNALANWRYSEFIRLTRIAERWLTAELTGLTVAELGRLMHDFVAAGGVIDQQRETRPEWTAHEYHYDLRIPIRGRLVYIETRLVYQKANDPDDPWIHVVNIHDA